MDPPFHYVRLTTFCYQTENKDMVREALSHVAYGDPDGDICEEAIEGQFGDTITVMHARLRRSRDIRALSRRVLPLLSEEDVEGKVDNKWFFHLRFDKEAAFHGHLEPSDGTNVVTLKGKIRVYPASRERAVACLREYVASNNN
ncbi:MAG: RNA-binding domain-containing protein [Thermoplasmatota archaeon]